MEKKRKSKKTREGKGWASKRLRVASQPEGEASVVVTA
jgi:hypothetical protein